MQHLHAPSNGGGKFFRIDYKAWIIWTSWTYNLYHRHQACVLKLSCFCMFPKLLLAGMVSLNSNMAGFPKGHLVNASKISTTTAKYMIQKKLHLCFFPVVNLFIYLWHQREFQKRNQEYRKYSKHQDSMKIEVLACYIIILNSSKLILRKMGIA